jgi:hypothetical protein
MLKSGWKWGIGAAIVALILGAVAFSDRQDKLAEQQKQVQKIQEEREKQAGLEREMKDVHEGRKPPMTAEELALAEAALAKGISIDDGQNDYAKVAPGTIQPDGRPDNPNPWPLPFTDLKNAKIGADEKYLYVKYTFWGKFPEKMAKVGDDYLTGVGVNLGLNDFYNHNTQASRQTGLLQTGLNYWSRDKEDNWNEADICVPPVLNTSTFGEPNSAVQYKGEDTYGIATGEGKTYGGAGDDYLVAEFPLSNLGLKYGDEIKFDLGTESGSKVFHHECIDPILDFGSAKMGKLIIWKIGSGSYTTEMPKF